MTEKTQQHSGKATHYSLAVLLTLYLAQGLPVGFMTQALPTLLRHYGVSLTQIGVSGLLMLPWAIKFLWAPYVDLYGLHPRRKSHWGHYRSWILFNQSLTILCLVILAFLPIDQLNQLSGLWGLFVVLFALNAFCATQDIATDGLAVNILNKGQLHWGNTFQVMGSRLGFILGGGAVLYAMDVLSWQTTFLGLAIAVLLNSLPIIFYHEPQFKQHQPHQPRQSILESSSQLSSKLSSPSTDQVTYSTHPFSPTDHSSTRQHSDKPHITQKLLERYGYLWHQPELKVWLVVVLTYKVADGLSGPILKPMMVDMDLSLSQIGIFVTMIGACFALLGALLAGWLIQRYRLSHMLIIFSILQSISLLYYVALAYCYEHGLPFSDRHLYIANALEELFSAMSLVAMLSLIMCYARAKYAGTDFTVQVALMSIVSGGLYIVSGKIADLFGYFNVLTAIFIISCLCLLPKLYWKKYYAPQ